MLHIKQRCNRASFFLGGDASSEDATVVRLVRKTQCNLRRTNDTDNARHLCIDAKSEWLRKSCTVLPSLDIAFF